MVDTIRKLDPHTIEVTRTKTAATVEPFDYGFLKRQRATIQAQKDRDSAQRDIELAEVDALLAEAEKLGVVEAQAQTPQTVVVQEVKG